MAATVSQVVGLFNVKLIGDCRVAAAIVRDGVFEPASLGAWAAILRSSNAKMIALDVGAYSGIYAISAAQHGHEAIAIEPKPRMAARVHGNAALNSVSVDVIEVAASDKNGAANLYYKQSSSLTSISSLNKQTHDTGSCLVETMRLDNLPIIDGHIGAIKIDVEGHEAAVIRGALVLIAKHKPVMLVETLDYEDRKEAVKKLLPGYRVVEFCDKRNLLMEPL